MYCTTIATCCYKNIIAIHISNYAANIAYNKTFIWISYRTYQFFDKSITVTCTGSHNIAAIINAGIYSINFISIIGVAKITGYTANIVCSTNSIFFICCIINISIFCTSNYAAYITGSIINILFAILSICWSITANICRVCYVFNSTIIWSGTGNTTYISNINWCSYSSIII